MFPPRNVLYPFAFNTKFISVVVVVFPSEPVIPTTLHGHIFNTSLTSVVIYTPFSLAFASSFLFGKNDGDLKIMS